jgi:hypothetical protein
LTAAGSATALSSHAAATPPADEGEVGGLMSGAEVSAPDGLIPRKLAVTGASAYDVPACLNEVAHIYSLGIGEVRCPAQTEWDAYHGSAFAWGSTNLREDYTTLAPFICDGHRTWEARPSPSGSGRPACGCSCTRPSTSALALPAQRGEGRLPGNRVLQGRGDAARSKRRGGGRALSVCARAPHPPNRTLLVVSRREVSCAAVGASCSVTSVSVEIAGAPPAGHQALASAPLTTFVAQLVAENALSAVLFER